MRSKIEINLSIDSKGQRAQGRQRWPGVEARSLEKSTHGAAGRGKVALHAVWGFLFCFAVHCSSVIWLTPNPWSEKMKGPCVFRRGFTSAEKNSLKVSKKKAMINDVFEQRP